MQLVVGLIGEIGSGKSLVSKHLKENYQASVHLFSGILMNVLDRLSLPKSRENLQSLGEGLRNSLGEDVLVNALRKDLEKDRAKILVIDGIRYPNEVALLRSFSRNVLLYIHTLPELRYKRCVARREKNEESLSFEEFMQNERRETERKIQEISRLADYSLDNSTGREDLLRRVDSIIQKKLN